MWEYNRISIFYKSIIELNQKLQVLGDNNWEIMWYSEDSKDRYERRHMVNILVKRPKKESED